MTTKKPTHPKGMLVRAKGTTGLFEKNEWYEAYPYVLDKNQVVIISGGPHNPTYTYDELWQEFTKTSALEDFYDNEE